MQCNLPRVVVDGESVAVAVDDDAEPAAIVDADAGAAPSLATESPNLLSLKPGNCNLAADMANGVDEEEEEEPNLGGLSTGFLSTAVAEEEAAPPPPLPASDILTQLGKSDVISEKATSLFNHNKKSAVLLYSVNLIVFDWATSKLPSFKKATSDGIWFYEFTK